MTDAQVAVGSYGNDDEGREGDVGSDEEMVEPAHRPAVHDVLYRLHVDGEGHEQGTHGQVNGCQGGNEEVGHCPTALAHKHVQHQCVACRPCQCQHTQVCDDDVQLGRCDVMAAVLVLFRVVIEGPVIVDIALQRIIGRTGL